MVRLLVALERHAVPVRRIMRQRVQPGACRDIRREDDELRVVRVGQDDLLAPVANDVANHLGVNAVGAGGAVVPDALDARQAVGSARFEPVPLLDLAVVVEL